MKHIIQNKMEVYKPMAQILSDAMEVFMREDIPTEYDDVAPSTQHEDQHVIFESTQSEQFEFYDPDRSQSQQQCDISAQLHLPVANCQSDVEIIDNMMSDDEYRHHIRSLNEKQYEFFLHVMNVATNREKQELCFLNGGARNWQFSLTESTVPRSPSSLLWRCSSK